MAECPKCGFPMRLAPLKNVRVIHRVGKDGKITHGYKIGRGA